MTTGVPLLATVARGTGTGPNGTMGARQDAAAAPRPTVALTRRPQTAVKIVRAAAPRGDAIFNTVQALTHYLISVGYIQHC